ncbi:MAG: DUF2271 domain-containing protein [Rheinheimera sp.]|nr:DUF2271 domain-containing protein [Rheinheimera sp.]
MQCGAGAGCPVLALPATASDLEIALQLPKISEGQYHRPYVAVWVEDSSEKSVRLIEIWREKPDWIKDLRRFWRKTGRADQPLVDARTGATKGPGAISAALGWQRRSRRCSAKRRISAGD